MCMWVDYKIEDSRSSCYLLNVDDYWEISVQFKIEHKSKKKMYSFFFEFIQLLPAMILKIVIKDFFFPQKGFIIEKKGKGKN